MSCDARYELGRDHIGLCHSRFQIHTLGDSRPKDSAEDIASAVCGNNLHLVCWNKPRLTFVGPQGAAQLSGGNDRAAPS